MTTAAVSRCFQTFLFCMFMAFPAQTMASLFVTVQYLVCHIHIVTRIALLGRHFSTVNMVAFHAYIHFLMLLVRECRYLPGGCRLHRYYFRSQISIMTLGKTATDTVAEKPYSQTADTLFFHLPPQWSNWMVKANSFFLLPLVSRKSTGKFHPSHAGHLLH